MTKVVSQRELQTKPLNSPSKTNGTTLYAVAHCHWEREWYESFEVQLVRLLNLLSDLQAEADTPIHRNGNTPGFSRKLFLMGGQTVILEDVAAIRPEMVMRLVYHNKNGRLALGPWYVSVNEALVSGESLLRNLLAARADAIRYNLKLMPVSYSPHVSGHTTQLPQLLTHFDVDTLIMKHRYPVTHIPFRWEAPNSSSILVVDYEEVATWGEEGDIIETVVEQVSRQKPAREDGPFLWLFNANVPSEINDIAPRVEEATDLMVTTGNLHSYSRALRKELPDKSRPALRGELHLPPFQQDSYISSGVFSTRIHLKQMNAHIESYLSRVVEPLLTLALTHGKTRYQDNLRVLLNFCWRTLVKNQAYNLLAGTTADAITQESVLAYQRIEDTAQQIIKLSLEALIKPDETQREANSVFLVVWNTLNWPVQKVVTTRLNLPAGKHPARLLCPDGEETAFCWRPETSTLEFLAEATGTGYITYTVIFGDELPAGQHLAHRYAGTSIAMHTGEALYIQDGKLFWQIDNHLIEDVLRFYDGGDAGDTYSYCPPTEDVIEKAELTNDIEVEVTPLYQRLILHHRLRVTPELTEDRQRKRGVKRLDLQTIATVYHHKPGVYFQTRFTNTVKDHRLRVHLRTNIDSETVMADSIFAITQRIAQVNPAMMPAELKHTLPHLNNTQPTQGLVAISNGRRTLATLTGGLPEYEALHEDDQLTVALTLVRSVGWLSRDDLHTRPGAVAPKLPTPMAQCQQEITAEYALVETIPGDGAALMQARNAFTTPLEVFQLAAPPEKRTRSYLSVVSDQAIGAHSDGDGAIMTALKPPEMGEGWIVRFYNPHDRYIELLVTPHQRPETVQYCNMAENPDGYLQTDANGRVTVPLKPYEIVTIRVNF